MKPIYITTWKKWEELSERYNFNPSVVAEFSIDLGGGNSKDYEYTGDMPEEGGNE